jgi:hypothetical protein
MNTRTTLPAASRALVAAPKLDSVGIDGQQSCSADFKPMTGDVGEATLSGWTPYRVGSSNLCQTTIPRPIAMSTRSTSPAIAEDKYGDGVAEGIGK